MSAKLDTSNPLPPVECRVPLHSIMIGQTRQTKLGGVEQDEKGPNLSAWAGLSLSLVEWINSRFRSENGIAWSSHVLPGSE